MNLKLRLAIGCLLAATATFAQGANLLEVYQRAQQSDPLLREADAIRLANREARPQAWAALLPQIDGSAGISRSNSTVDSQRPRPVLDPVTTQPILDPVTNDPIISTGVSTTITDRTSWGITLRQTIFNWSRWATLDRARTQVAQAEVTYSAAQQDLIVRVAQRYFNALAAKDTLDANNAAADAFSRQLEQAEKRFEVGLIAITDVQEARAERDRATADVISAKRALATNLELLRELTGEAVDNLAAPGDDMPLKTPDPASEDRWVASALEQNLTLTSARLSAEIADANVSIARAGHLPTLDLTASRSYGDSESARRSELTNGVNRIGSGSLEDPGYSVGLQLTVPLFSSGATQSGVRQSIYQRRAAQERAERSARETERAARDNYLGVISNISRVQALKQALESSQTAIQATEAGFEVGTRTTVDVLQARRAVYNAQTLYARSRYDYILSVIQLKQAAGTLSAEDVAEINTWLQ
jgi:outer membrane protein